MEFNSALTPNSTYFWRVTATDGLNTCLGTSDVYKFKTGNQAGFAPAPGPIGHYFRVSPNPVQTNQDLIIQFDSEINDRSGVTKVYNSSGLLLLEEHTSIFKGENVWSVSIKNLPPNVYFLQLQTENTFQTQKFLVH